MLSLGSKDDLLDVLLSLGYSEDSEMSGIVSYFLFDLVISEQIVRTNCSALVDTTTATLKDSFFSSPV